MLNDKPKWKDSGRVDANAPRLEPTEELHCPECESACENVVADRNSIRCETGREIHPMIESEEAPSAPRLEPAEELHRPDHQSAYDEIIADCNSSRCEAGEAIHNGYATMLQELGVSQSITV